MHDISFEVMTKRIAELPEPVRAVLFSEETTTNIEAIGRQNRLMIDQLGDLSEIITFVIMGFVSPKNFAAEVAQKLQIDPKLAEQIAAEINTQIFSKIREELQKLNNEPAGAPIAPEPKPYTPAATPRLTTDDRRLTTDDLRPTTDNQQPTTITPTPPTDLESTQGRSGENIAIAPKIETTPFEHKLKEDDIFRAPAVVSEHEAPEPMARPTTDDKQPTTGTLKLPPLPTKAEMKYGGKDPYREELQ